jgi:hypothetical protein
MRPVNNGNVNGIVSNNNNFNSNDIVPSRWDRERNIDRIADTLLGKFNLPESSRGFMCLAARTLSEARIWQHYETSQTAKKSKVGLFIYLCQKDGVRKA